MAISYEKGLFAAPKIAKIAGVLTNFQGLRCYVVRAHSTFDNTLMTIRAFAANGHFYQLIAALPGPEAPTETTAEVMFAAFKFTRPPQALGTQSGETNTIRLNPFRK
jgi:hypothetical protein